MTRLTDPKAAKGQNWALTGEGPHAVVGRIMIPAQLAMLRHLAKAGHELFRDDADYETYLGILRALAAEGWIELQVWPPANRMGPQHRRRRFAIARIMPAGRLAASALDRADTA